MEDAKVRPSHRENNGKVFAWDKPPPTFHPGIARNCRCWAEAVIATFSSVMERFVEMNNVKTWPDVPINGPFKVDLATRSKETQKRRSEYL